MNISYNLVKLNVVKLIFRQFILNQCRKFRHIFFLQNGFTPLHIAAKYGNQNVAGVLIQHGANIDYKTKVQYYVYRHLNIYYRCGLSYASKVSQGIKMVNFFSCDSPYLINFARENCALLSFVQVCEFPGSL